MSTFLCKNGVRKEYFLTPTFIIEPFLWDEWLLSGLIGWCIVIDLFLGAQIVPILRKNVPSLLNSLIP